MNITLCDGNVGCICLVVTTFFSLTIDFLKFNYRQGQNLYVNDLRMQSSMYKNTLQPETKCRLPYLYDLYICKI